MQHFRRYLPWIALVLAVVYVGRAMRPRTDRDGDFRLAAFGSLPVRDAGRIKPLDSFARVELMLMNRRQEYKTNDDSQMSLYEAFFNTRSRPAVRWLMNLMADGMIESAATLDVEPDVQAWLGLKDQGGQGRFGLGEVMAAARAKGQKFKELFDKKDKGALDPLEQKVLAVGEQAVARAGRVRELREGRGKEENPDAQKVFRVDHDQLLAMLQLEPRDGFRYSYDEITHADERAKQGAFAGFVRKAQQARQIQDRIRQGMGGGQQLDTTDLRAMELYKQLSMHRALQSLDAVTLVPDPEFSPTGWKTLAESLGDPNPNARHLQAMVAAYAENDPKEFNKELDAYSRAVNAALPREASMARLESWFNQFAPFYLCANLYGVVLVMAFLSWLVWPKELGRAAFFLLSLTLVVHTASLIVRMVIQGRPPVVNLYSSAVFIGWGCAVVCYLMELIYRNAVPTAVGSLLGLLTMIIAHHLGGSGDTMEVLQAVLDTNFWLATHVTIVTLGYTATFVAGFLAIAFLWRMFATTVLASFRNRGQEGWTSPLPLIASSFGLVGVPAVLLIGIVWGKYYLWFGNDPFSSRMAIPLMLPIAIGAAIYASLIVIRHGAPDLQPGEVPRMIEWVKGLNLSVETSKAFMNAIYGVVCFGLLLSFVGTVLGGIWADQSWGRFWGWDPKENGAILVVIINGLILHARWGGMIKERGTVMLAIAGNMVTMWSWFGTNQLGIGLHSYGFNNALIAMCTSFWLSQVVLLGLAALPAKYWKAYAAVPGGKAGKAAKLAPAGS